MRLRCFLFPLIRRFAPMNISYRERPWIYLFATKCSLYLFALLQFLRLSQIYIIVACCRHLTKLLLSRTGLRNIDENLRVRILKLHVSGMYYFIIIIKLASVAGARIEAAVAALNMRRINLIQSQSQRERVVIIAGVAPSAKSTRRCCSERTWLGAHVKIYKLTSQRERKRTYPIRNAPKRKQLSSDPNIYYYVSLNSN